MLRLIICFRVDFRKVIRLPAATLYHGQKIRLTLISLNGENLNVLSVCGWSDNNYYYHLIQITIKNSSLSQTVLKTSGQPRPLLAVPIVFETIWSEGGGFWGFGSIQGVPKPWRIHCRIGETNNSVADLE